MLWDFKTFFRRLYQNVPKFRFLVLRRTLENWLTGNLYDNVRIFTRKWPFLGRQQIGDVVGKWPFYFLIEAFWTEKTTKNSLGTFVNKIEKISDFVRKSPKKRVCRRFTNKNYFLFVNVPKRFLSNFGNFEKIFFSNFHFVVFLVQKLKFIFLKSDKKKLNIRKNSLFSLYLVPKTTKLIRNLSIL